MPEPVIRQIDLTDDAQCAATRAYLDKVLFHPLPEKSWKWEYYYDDRTVVSVLQSHQGILGTQTFLPVDLVVNGERVLTAKSENSYVDESLRGTLAFKNLYEAGIAACKRNGVDTFWGFTRLGKWMREKMHYRVYDDWVHEAVLPLRVRPFSHYRKHHGPLRGVAAALRHAFVSRSAMRKIKALANAGGDASWRGEPRVWNDVNNFLNRVLGDQCVRLDMHEKYFTWRVTNNPNVDYATEFLYHESELAGYYTIGFLDGVAHIAEIVAHDRSHALVTARVWQTVIRRRAYAVSYFGNAHHALCKQLFGHLQWLGARVVPNPGMLFCVRMENDRYNALLDRKEAWYLNALWTEGYRM